MVSYVYRAKKNITVDYGKMSIPKVSDRLTETDLIHCFKHVQSEDPEVEPIALSPEMIELRHSHEDVII